MGIEPATLDKLITIERPDKTGTPATGETVTWTPIHTGKLWARLLPQKADERLQAAQEKSLIMYRVTIRNRAGIDASMRVKWGDLVMNIRGVPTPNRLSGYLDLDCELNAPV